MWCGGADLERILGSRGERGMTEHKIEFIIALATVLLGLYIGYRIWRDGR